MPKRSPPTNFKSSCRSARIACSRRCFKSNCSATCKTNSNSPSATWRASTSRAPIRSCKTSKRKASTLCSKAGIRCRRARRILCCWITPTARIKSRLAFTTVRPAYSLRQQRTHTHGSQRRRRDDCPSGRDFVQPRRRRVTAVGKDVTLKLKGGDLGVSMDRPVERGHVFAVSRIVEEGGQRRAARIEWALLEVLDPPVAGVCRCTVLEPLQGRHVERPGDRAIRLPTMKEPVRLQLLDDDDMGLKPLNGIRVHIKRPGSR